MQRTTDHDEIRRWTEERGGRPVLDPERIGIDFSAYKGDPGPTAISWDHFFDRFERERLAFHFEVGDTPAGPVRVWRLGPR